MYGFKTIVPALLASAVLLGSLSSCGNSTNGGSSTDSAAGNNTSEGTVHLTYYMVGSETPDNDKVWEKVSELTKEKINATVEMNVIDWGDYGSKLQLMVASQEDVDIFFTANWLPTVDYITMSYKNALYPLNDLLPTAAPDLQAFIPESLWAGASVNGIIYGVPTYKEIAVQQAVGISTEIYERYNWDLSGVKTLADISPFLADLKNDPEIDVAYAHNGSSYMLIDNIYPLSGSLPGAVRAEDPTKVINQYETQEFKEYFELMFDWYSKGYMPTMGEEENKMYALEQQRCGFYGMACQPTIQNQMETNFGYPFTIVPITQKYVGSESAIGAINVLTANCKDPVKALQFLELVNLDQEVKDLVTYGIEGEHYTRNADGTVTLPESLMYYQESYMTGSIFTQSLLATEDPNKIENYKKFNEGAVDSPLLGFNFVPDQVAAEIAACSDAAAEYLTQMESGYIDPAENLPKLIAALKVAGSDAILAEMQAQYDEFLALK